MSPGFIFLVPPRLIAFRRERTCKATPDVARHEKAAISAKLAGNFERLGSRVGNWQARMAILRKGRLYGRFFAASREKLLEMAERLKVRHVFNLASCAVT